VNNNYQKTKQNGTYILTDIDDSAAESVKKEIQFTEISLLDIEKSNCVPD